MKLIISLLLFITPLFTKAQNELKIGTKAPKIEFQTSYPSDYMISKRKPIFLDFWATWCGPCIAGLIEHKEMVKKYSNKMEFIAISDSTSRKVIQFIKNTKLLNKFIIDKGIQTHINFGVEGIPYAFLIDTNNTIVWAGSARKFSEKMIIEFLETNAITINKEDDAFDKSRFNNDTAPKLEYVLTILNQSLLNKHKSQLISKKEDLKAGAFSNAPEMQGVLTVINYTLKEFLNRTQIYFQNKMLTNKNSNNLGYDFIKIDFMSFEKMNAQLLRDYGIVFLQKK